MSTPQPGIFAQGTRSHYHLEFDLRAGAPSEEVGDALARLREPAVTAGGSNLVIGFGPELWGVVAPEPVPDALAPFAGVEGPGRRVPSTPHDIWVWLHGTGPDVMLDNARAVVAAIGPCAELKSEAPCFVYLDSRDLTGFVDGTENPPMQDKMLARMYGTTGDGLYDQLTDFTQPQSAAYYFAPSLEALAALGE